ncbi:hypothetical protein GCM10009850_070310 [Nonomuraea monospora]|uniref:Uncharacterized protein n=1 Tax=Nonomuraea monospora TaxID=568818 RepID=A0ABN3CQ70_9ACTN
MRIYYHTHVLSWHPGAPNARDVWILRTIPPRCQPPKGQDRKPPVSLTDHFHGDRHRNQAHHNGIHQHRDGPMTRSARSSEAPNAANTQNMIVAAAVMTRAVPASPPPYP